MRLLVFTASSNNLEIALAERVMGFSGRRSPRGDSTFGEDGWVNEPGIGDRALLYAIGAGIAGVVDVTSTIYRSSEQVWSDAPYPWRVGIKPVAVFPEPLPLPDEVTGHGIYRANPRLLSDDEARHFMESLGRQLLGDQQLAAIS
jgi:hypothetical protein